MFGLDKIKKIIAEKVIKQFAPSLIRGLIKAVAGAITVAGIPNVATELVGIEPQLTNIGVALVLFGFATLWSFIDKPKGQG